jgi:glycosyltransferase involved in cell wall biosynthesis
VVSIVITNYNYQGFVAEAIQSALKQTYPSIEIIVVDDGSTDQSLKTINEFKQITLIKQTNQGVVLARNNGATVASGDYLIFLDADDILQPEYVSALMSAMQSQANAAVAYCDFEFFGLEDHAIKACPWNVRKLLYRNYIVSGSLIKKSVFDEVGGYSADVNTKTSFEDWDLWLSVAEKGYKGVYVPQTLYRYRLHGKGRNAEALKKRPELEKILAIRHPSLYGSLTNRAYLAIFKTASRLRNTLITPPGN